MFVKLSVCCLLDIAHSRLWSPIKYRFLHTNLLNSLRRFAIEKNWKIEFLTFVFEKQQTCSVVVVIIYNQRRVFIIFPLKKYIFLLIGHFVKTFPGHSTIHLSLNGSVSVCECTCGRETANQNNIKISSNWYSHNTIIYIIRVILSFNHSSDSNWGLI